MKSIATLVLALVALDAQAAIEDYNVIWDSPSKDHHGSMPLGNGDISLNAWMEPNGDLCFYIGKTDSWGDNGRLLKMGKVRVSLSPNPLTSGANFKQTLNLQNGEILIDIKGDNPTKLKLWVDANNALINIETESQKPVKATAKIELWRTERSALSSVEIGDHRARYPKTSADMKTYVEPDTLLKELKDGIGWYHRNEKSDGPAMSMKFQGLEAYTKSAVYKDPLLHRIFGAVIKAEGGQRLSDKTLISKAAKKQSIAIAVNTLHPGTSSEWLSANEALFRKSKNTARCYLLHKQWWSKFWQRSHLSITESQRLVKAQQATAHNDAFIVSRGYNLQRFIDACGGRGRYPIKFNGSIFTVPAKGKPGNADYRRWGACYWWQNTRLPYTSMCMSGDFDLMKPLFRFYVDEILPVNKFRTKKYFGIEGAYFLEMTSLWGTSPMGVYGWDKPMKDRKDPLQRNRYHKWEWVAGPELVFMMLNYYAHTGDEKFLKEKILPTAKAVASFFKNFYKKRSGEKMVMYPSMACETWWDCTNPMPEVAGLHAITDQLIELSSEMRDNDKEFWLKFKTILPAIPLRDTESGKALAPAEKYARKGNRENPELYGVFPFRHIAVGKPNLELGLNALKHRWNRGAYGWYQSSIFMAYLGLADQAQANIIKRAKNSNKNSRFPAFWGPNFDWVPDQDHGGVLMKAVQSLLMQVDGKKIYLLPAWPKNWNASFKLNAPYKTIVEATVQEGKITNLKVTPESRRKDVVIRSSLDE